MIGFNKHDFGLDNENLLGYTIGEEIENTNSILVIDAQYN